MSQETLDLGDVAEVPTFSVSELTTQVSDALRRAFPEQVWVRGEVQNLKRYPSGHTYFSLVEKAAGPGDRVRPASTPSCSATTAPPSRERSRKCRARSSATTSRCASAAGWVCTRGSSSSS